MARALIIGGGAIGRGFLPWVLRDLEIDIFDSSEELCNGITRRGSYSSFISREGTLQQGIFKPGRFTSKVSDLCLRDYSIAFIAIGPRNCANLPKEFAKLNCPVFSLENDPKTIEVLSNDIGLNQVFFGVPDVIASSTASPVNLKHDRFSLHTEDGVLYLEDSKSFPSDLYETLTDVVWATRSDIDREWDAKLFLHNTPHCVAAYLGHLNGNTYLHEGFDKPFILNIVEGVIEELVLALKRTTDHDHSFLENYAEKELRRFSNKLLYDPILRVAREPLRKLAIGGRLMGALSMCILAGVNPIFLNAGICAALNFVDQRDQDFVSMSHFSEIGVTNFLKYFLNVQPDSMESKYIDSTFDQALKFIKEGLE